MDDATDLLALRKDVLVARAALQRLKIARDVEALRGSLRWPRTVAAVAASRPARSALMALLLLLGGPGRAVRLVGAAAGIVGVIKLWQALAARREAALESPHPTPRLDDEAREAHGGT